MSAAPREAIGRDGWAILVLSSVLVLASLGTSLAAAVAHVAWVGFTAPAKRAGFSRVLVLGMRLGRDGGVPDDYRARLERARTLLDAEPGAEAFLLGGVTGELGVSEAEAGDAWLRRSGIAAARIHTEQKSRHTLENLRHYRADFPPVDRVLLVTNRFHLARSSLLASGLGIEHARCAAEQSRWRLRPAPMLKEAVLIHWYLTGRLYAWLARDRAMAARLT